MTNFDKNNDSYCTISMLQNLYHVQFDNNAEMNKLKLIRIRYFTFFFISAREATILHTLKYILYIFLFYNWMDIWLVILYMVINQGYIIIVIFKFTFSYLFIETANLKSQLFHNNFFRRQVLWCLVSLIGSIKINLAQRFAQQVKIAQLLWVFCNSK